MVNYPRSFARTKREGVGREKVVTVTGGMGREKVVTVTGGVGREKVVTVKNVHKWPKMAWRLRYLKALRQAFAKACLHRKYIASLVRSFGQAAQADHTEHPIGWSFYDVTGSSAIAHCEVLH